MRNITTEYMFRNESAVKAGVRVLQFNAVLEACANALEPPLKYGRDGSRNYMVLLLTSSCTVDCIM